MSEPPVALFDTSGSMAFTDDESARRRVELATEVMQGVLAATPRMRVVTFGVQVAELAGIEPGPNLQLPEPAGGTPLDKALGYIAERGWRPNHIVVISDGQPDDRQAAIAAAKALAPVVIDAIYVGPDTDPAAIGFMRVLSLAGGTVHGISGRRSLANPEKLADEIVLRLGGPAQ